MIKIIRTDSDNKDFRALVELLDAELAVRDGADHSSIPSLIKLIKSGM